MKSLPLYNREFERLYCAFREVVINKGYSKGKDSSYPSCIREFLHFISGKGIDDIKKVSIKEIIVFYEYLKKRPNARREGGISDSHIRTHIYSLRLFFDHLLDIGEIEKAPARLPRFQFVKCREREILSIEEIKILYEHTKNATERAILGLAYGCGLRRTEIEKLNIHDVIFQQGIVVVREGKGNKNRTVPMSDKVIKDLKEYVIYERSERFYSNVASLMVNRWGKRMRGQSINCKLQELIKRIGNQELIKKEVSLHSLRHSIATHLIDNGVGIEFVRKFLGHALLDTTHLYSKRRKQKNIMHAIK
jgi:site-specific recombinase XerD